MSWTTLLSGSIGLLTASVVLLITQRYDREKREAEEQRWREDRASEERRWANDREALERRWHADRAREEARRQSEEARWYGQPFLQRRFDALSAVHVVLVESRFALLMPASPTFEAGWGVKQLEQQDRDLKAKQVELIRTTQMAALYLADEQYKTVDAATRAFIAVTNDVLVRLSIHREDLVNRGAGAAFFQAVELNEYERLEETRGPALRVLRDLLTPLLPRGAVADTATDTP